MTKLAPDPPPRLLTNVNKKIVFFIEVFPNIVCLKKLGHVDFSYEVTRSLRACQGVVLLVDANQGVQAQTVSNFYLAFAHSLQILAVLNKIDLPRADVDGVREQVSSTFETNIFCSLGNYFVRYSTCSRSTRTRCWR